MRDATGRGQPLDDVGFVKRFGEEWKARKAQALADPLEIVIKYETRTT